MPDYTIIMSKKAQKQLDKLPENIAGPIIEGIASLETDPRLNRLQKTKGGDGYRIPMGDYGVIYDVFDSELIVDVITPGHRKDIYE